MVCIYVFFVWLIDIKRYVGRSIIYMFIVFLISSIIRDIEMICIVKE